MAKETNAWFVLAGRRCFEWCLIKRGANGLLGAWKPRKIGWRRTFCECWHCTCEKQHAVFRQHCAVWGAGRQLAHSWNFCLYLLPDRPWLCASLDMQVVAIPQTRQNPCISSHAWQWLPNSECRVFREPCPYNDHVCEASFEACSLQPDIVTPPGTGATYSITSQTATIPRDRCTGPHASGCASQQPCLRRTFIQVTSPSPHAPNTKCVHGPRYI